MQRRSFIANTLATGLGVSVAAKSPAGFAQLAAKAAGVLHGSPVVSGPAADTIVVLQPVRGPATGFLEVAVGEGAMRRVDAESSGLLPLEQYVLKFRLPALPSGQVIRYRVTAREIDFQNAYKILPGTVESTAIHSFRTLDPEAAETRFVVWNDTHENLETIRALQRLTAEFKPDFLLWNGDQTNDVYDPAKMTAQYLAPDGLEIAARWPLAYARGNHDVRGPAARHLVSFTGTPGDRYYYGFRSGPLAALVLDTGEDKPDDHPVFAGLAGFAAMRQRQHEWLASAIREPWFLEAPLRVLFCHIPLWWTDEAKDVGYWLYSKPCRDSWLPLLREAGVQLVVSGHTHQATWLPANVDRPIGQLIGGGPQPKSATIIEGIASRGNLVLQVKSLDGDVVETVNVVHV